MNFEKASDHVIQVVLNQIVEVNKLVKTTNDNKELDDHDKIATRNFAHHHLLVLSIILKEFEEYARSKYPQTAEILNWAMQNYQFGLDNKQFTPCSCNECIPKEA